MTTRLKPGEQRDPCGCVHNSRAWVIQCATHTAESTEIHARWRADHEARRAQEDTTP